MPTQTEPELSSRKFTGPQAKQLARSLSKVQLAEIASALSDDQVERVVEAAVERRAKQIALRVLDLLGGPPDLEAIDRPLRLYSLDDVEKLLSGYKRATLQRLTREDDPSPLKYTHSPGKGRKRFDRATVERFLESIRIPTTVMDR